MAKLLANLLAALLTTLPSLASAELPQVRWLVLDFVPYHVLEGPNRGTGLRDQYLDTLIRRLPEFRHQIEISGTERMFVLMKTGQPVCTLSMLRVPERESFAVFSNKPYFWQLAPVLIARKGYTPPSGWQRDKDGEVSLSGLLERGGVTLGTLPKRRFGKELDDVIERMRAEHPGTVLDFTEHGLLAGLLRLVGRGRVDVTLGYAIEVEQLRRDLPELGEFDYFGLVEAPDMIPTYVSCSRSPLGRDVISAVNALSGMDTAKQKLRDQYGAMLPEGERKRYRAQLQSADKLGE
ncbi:TIGR02285 family protein [Niveibacterium umoris]|uniref:Uncharacterized protein (TIGR02285 family) n=1 Tax=Niveibacterium umoris TaxID=1193620 RepID=A0A840BSQ0_9RHOO|nr:uncharacterized protein (TIGR02285 family) [Niveibacterium umoris]